MSSCNILFTMLQEPITHIILTQNVTTFTDTARNRFHAQGLRGYPSPKRGTTMLYIAQRFTTTHRQHP